RNAPFNLKSFGTGPFMVEDFKPGDLLTYAVNPNYREPNKPFFNRVEVKGGGDAVSAARAVFQTGEYDYAWNLQVEAQVLNDGRQKIGIETELKSVDAGVFFSSAPSNPDTYAHFSTDVEMFTSTFDNPYPVIYMKRFYSADPDRDWAQKANNWAPQNFMKWS